MARAASFALSKRLISPRGVRTSTGFFLLNCLRIVCAKVFSSSVGVRICVQLFMVLPQYDACCGVLLPLLLQHEGVALLLALVVQLLNLVGGFGVEVVFAGDDGDVVAVVGFDDGLGLLGVGGGGDAKREA